MLHQSNAIFADFTSTSANGMISFGYKKLKNKEFENVAYFEPFYLKDFLATKPKKLLVQGSEEH